VTSGRTDNELLEALYTEHGQALLAYALRLSGDQEVAEEVVQDALLRAWTHPDALDGRQGTPRAWLFTVVRNLVTDAHRRKQVRLRAVPPFERHQTYDGVDRAVEEWVLRDAFGLLSIDHQTVLRHVVHLGQSVREAAAALGIPPGTVKSRTYYALHALRLALEEMGYPR
jgi:RNA polymerase sigma-70 factor (ECF subfamily)